MHVSLPCSVLLCEFVFFCHSTVSPVCVNISAEWVAQSTPRSLPKCLKLTKLYSHLVRERREQRGSRAAVRGGCRPLRVSYVLAQTTYNSVGFPFDPSDDWTTVPPARESICRRTMIVGTVTRARQGKAQGDRQRVRDTYMTPSELDEDTVRHYRILRTCSTMIFVPKLLSPPFVGGGRSNETETLADGRWFDGISATRWKMRCKACNHRADRGAILLYAVSRRSVCSCANAIEHRGPILMPMFGVVAGIQGVKNETVVRPNGWTAFMMRVEQTRSLSTTAAKDKTSRRLARISHICRKRQQFVLFLTPPLCVCYVFFVVEDEIMGWL